MTVGNLPPISEVHGPAALMAPPLVAATGGDDRLSRGAVSWSLYEGARNPSIVLMTIFIFMPYVSTTLVGDPVLGQELVSRYAQYAGWLVALTAPLLGAAIDRIGRRKPGLLIVTTTMVSVNAILWWAAPDGSGLTLPLIMALTMIGSIAFAYSEVLHNSLLVRAAGLAATHKASGLALSLGNLFSVFALAFVAYAFALPGMVDWGWIPRTPLFDLSRRLHEPERLVGPIAAVILGLGAMPLFFFTPDAPRSGQPLILAFRDGARELFGMAKGLRGYRDAAVFLVARMFYTDGMTALLAFMGIYASGVMKWGSAELLLYGLAASVFAVLGGYVGRWMDGAIGPRRSVQIAIGMSAIGIVCLIGMSTDRILYLTYDIAVHGRFWKGPFSTLPELVFLGVAMSNAVFVTAQYASSRTLLTRLTPPERTGAFFGIYALSGTATVWLGALLVNVGTRITHSQQGGFAAIALLLSIGFGLLAFVRGEDGQSETLRQAVPTSDGVEVSRRKRTI